MKSHNYLFIILAAAVVLAAASPLQADVLAYWQFNEATSGAIPTTGDPLLDSSGNGHLGNGRGSVAWAPGVTGVPDGSMKLSGFSGVGALMNHSDDYNLKLGDLTAYRLELNLEPDDYAASSRSLLGYHNSAGGPGYRFSLTGGSSTGENYGGRIELTLWDSANFYWQSYSDPTKAYVPDYRVNPGTWYHLAVEIHPNANQAQTYIQFYIDGVDAGRMYYGDAVLNGPTMTNRRSGDLVLGNMADPTSKFAVGCMEGTFSYNYALKGSYDNVKLSTVIPEPSTLALLAAGLVGLLAYAWRKRK